MTAQNVSEVSTSMLSHPALSNYYQGISSSGLNSVMARTKNAKCTPAGSRSSPLPGRKRTFGKRQELRSVAQSGAVAIVASRRLFLVPTSAAAR